jgi:hypothetical protein
MRFQQLLTRNRESLVNNLSCGRDCWWRRFEFIEITNFFVIILLREPHWFAMWNLETRAGQKVRSDHSVRKKLTWKSHGSSVISLIDRLVIRNCHAPIVQKQWLNIGSWRTVPEVWWESFAIPLEILKSRGILTEIRSPFENKSRQSERRIETRKRK